MVISDNQRRQCFLHLVAICSSRYGKDGRKAWWEAELPIMPAMNPPSLSLPPWTIDVRAPVCPMEANQLMASMPSILART